MSVPDRIGRFVVTGAAGGGGFATVFRAQDEALQSAVAIKVLSGTWAHDTAMHDRFLAEARLLRRADSDRVVRVHDIGDLPDGRPYLVMTFADGGTLHERLAGPLPWRSAVAIAVEIALGLRVLHDAGILHRDIKPSNVLFRSQPGGREQLVLGDLGLGRLLTEGAVPTLVAGTPGYMAPEQGIVGAPVSVRTDVYAVGAVLFRALTGRGPGEPDIVVYPGPHSTVPPSRLVAGLPQVLDHVVLRCMARDPEHRYPDIASLLTDLHQATQPSQPLPAQQPISQPLPAQQPGQPYPGQHPGQAQPSQPQFGQTVQHQPTQYPTAAQYPTAQYPTAQYQPTLYQPAQFTPPHGHGTPNPRPHQPPPGAPRTGRRWLVAAAAVVLLAAVTGLVAYAPWQRTVEVDSDPAGIQLTVPRGWAGEAATNGWNPNLLGLEGGTQPGVLVAASAAAFANTGDARPGAFAGALPPDTEPATDAFLAAVYREDCTELDTRGGTGDTEDSPDGTVNAAVPVGGGADGVLASLRQRCGEVLLDDVLVGQSGRLAWIQVKQPAATATSAADVVASVRLG